MQVTFRPLQLLSRLLAAAIVALPLAALNMAVDEFERQAVAKMSHQELIAFVTELHSATYAGAYVHSAILLLIFVVAVEAVAFAIRLVAGLFAAGKPPGARDDEFLPERAETFP